MEPDKEPVPTYTTTRQEDLLIKANEVIPTGTHLIVTTLLNSSLTIMPRARLTVVAAGSGNTIEVKKGGHLDMRIDKGNNITRE